MITYLATTKQTVPGVSSRLHWLSVFGVTQEIYFVEERKLSPCKPSQKWLQTSSQIRMPSKKRGWYVARIIHLCCQEAVLFWNHIVLPKAGAEEVDVGLKFHLVRTTFADVSVHFVSLSSLQAFVSTSLFVYGVCLCVWKGKVKKGRFWMKYCFIQWALWPLSQTHTFIGLRVLEGSQEVERMDVWMRRCMNENRWLVILFLSKHSGCRIAAIK